ncbi:acyl-CoA dehydrogenase family protein [Actinomadura sp. CNU-125]|uniref:acyl-CoA dehydrogenase family protein n=1 Tax=Actinomadura sp. CNU-125 TaxID=1904961 RepID=UPI003966B682
MSSCGRRWSHSTSYGATRPSCRGTSPSARSSSRSRRRSGAQGLWATHLGPELGGQGFGQLKLALLNEILGRSPWASHVFGCQAPDTGNAEIIAHYGTEEQKERYLRPLLEGEIFSSYSMTEPHAGADPTRFTCRAVKDGDEWVINGRKYFSSNAKTASFLIVMAVTDTEVSRYEGMSMFLVPTDTPGIEIERNVGLYGEPMNEGFHALIRYDDVRVPAASLLGGEGRAFAVAQTRLGGGRIHHAMRTIGLAQKALDMMCERALSRETQGGRLADKQFVQGYIADSYAQLVQFRLFVLYTAWRSTSTTTTRRSARTSPRPRSSCRPCCTTSPGGPCRSTARSAPRTRCRSSR